MAHTCSERFLSNARFSEVATAGHRRSTARNNIGRRSLLVYCCWSLVLQQVLCASLCSAEAFDVRRAHRRSKVPADDVTVHATKRTVDENIPMPGSENNDLTSSAVSTVTGEERGSARIRHRRRPLATATRFVVRRYHLYNVCSEGFVTVADGKVNASVASPDNEFSMLRVETVGFHGRLNIRSDRTGQYLCFNQKGHLTVKPSARSPGCILREIVADSFFTAFQSTVNPDWYVGFNRHGHRLSGHYWIRHLGQKQCYNFVKMDRPLSNGNDNGDDNPLMAAARSQYLHRTLPPDDASRSFGHPATT